MSEKFVVLDAELAKKYDVEIRYVLMGCNRCNSTWGITLNGSNVLEPRNLICRNCAAEYVHSNNIKI
jgi:hypothetical protein